MNGVGPLVSTEWLAAHLAEPNIRIADASWYLPQAGRNARAEYEAAHIPGAVFFDIDALSDQNTTLPHMLPDAVAFSSGMRKLGIGDSHFVVFYDGAGIYSAARGLWMMRAMGHSNAAVLDGGLPKWRREGRAVESTSSAKRGIGARHFTAKPDSEIIRDFDSLRDNLQSRAEQVVDARSPSRFRGEEAEPRPGVRPGHIPGSINVYYADVLTPEGTMRSPSELKTPLRRTQRRPGASRRHQLRLGGYGGDPFARARNRRREKDRAVRRLMVRVGRTRGRTDRDGALNRGEARQGNSGHRDLSRDGEARHPTAASSPAC